MGVDGRSGARRCRCSGTRCAPFGLCELSSPLRVLSQRQLGIVFANIRKKGYCRSFRRRRDAGFPATRPARPPLHHGLNLAWVSPAAPPFPLQSMARGIRWSNAPRRKLPPTSGRAGVAAAWRGPIMRAASASCAAPALAAAAMTLDGVHAQPRPAGHGPLHLLGQLDSFNSTAVISTPHCSVRVSRIFRTRN